jgi:outer membrane translocation and assembly module TamA
MVSLSVQSENRNLIPDYVSFYKLKRINHNFKSAIFEYNVNTLDNKHFPTKGIKAHFSIGASKLVSAKIIRGSEAIRFEKAYAGTIGFKKFFSINGSLSQYIPLSKKWTIGINGNILYISDTDSISSQNNFFFLGGFESINNRSVAMVGFHPYQIPVRKMAGIGLNINYELIDKVYLDFCADIYDKKDIENPGKTTLLKGIGFGAGYMSIFGPLRVGLMYGFYNHERYFDRFKGYITLGYNF